MWPEVTLLLIGRTVVFYKLDSFGGRLTAVETRIYSLQSEVDKLRDEISSLRIEVEELRDGSSDNR